MRRHLAAPVLKPIVAALKWRSFEDAYVLLDQAWTDASRPLTASAAAAAAASAHLLAALAGTS